jgi:preprotein translocase subunit YajC
MGVAEEMPANYTAAILWMAAIIALWYWMWFRPQQKQRKAQDEMMSALKIGDHVMTAGGLYGVLRGMEDDTIELEIAAGVVVRFAKGAIVRVDEPEDAIDD